jgi:transcriptional regulator with XRE-family HTH domain
MKAVVELRKRLGITQQELADFLQMERSTLSLIELSRREFSAEALAKLGRLQLADIKSQSKAMSSDAQSAVKGHWNGYLPMETASEQYAQEFNESLIQRIEECMQTAERLLSKILWLEERIQIATHKQQVLQYLKEQPPTDAEVAANEARWVAVQEEEVNRCLAPKQRAEVVILRLRAAALQLEAQQLERAMTVVA